MEIHFPYHSTYEDLTEFVYDVLNSIFDIKNMKQYCLFDETCEKLYIDKKLLVNNHYEYLQYVNLILKKK
jgi:hypothetical protein